MDVETGELGAMTTKPKGGSPVFRETHPDTGTRVDGSAVPSWETVRDEVLDLADEYKHLWRYLGWDGVVTDEDGSIAVLEANSRPDVDLVQVHEPLLADPRVRRFFDHHGAV